MNTLKEFDLVTLRHPHLEAHLSRATWEQWYSSTELAKPMKSNSLQPTATPLHWKH